MDKIISLEDARKAAHEVADKAQSSSNERKNVFEALMAEIDNINPAMGGMDELAMLLSLPDEAFSQIGPVFLDELEKSYNNVNDKLFLAQAMNAAGLKMEDVQDEYQKLIDSIDEQMEGLLTAQKRDFLKKMLAITYNCVADTNGCAKKVILIPLEYCKEGAKMPAYANVTDAGADVYALEDITIAPGETKLIPIGIKVAIPNGYELQVRPKSGRTLKSKLRVGNAPGTIDSGYRDEIGVIIDNIDAPIKKLYTDENGNITGADYGSSYTIGKGEKFAQLILSEVPKASYYEVESVAGIGENRGGGFGSTGLK